jgi:putative transposase
MKFIKGTTSRKLQVEFPELKKRYLGQHLWARSYYVCSTGNVTTKMIEEYIKHHFEGSEGKDAFELQEP